MNFLRENNSQVAAAREVKRTVNELAGMLNNVFLDARHRLSEERLSKIMGCEKNTFL